MQSIRVGRFQRPGQKHKAVKFCYPFQCDSGDQAVSTHRVISAKGNDTDPIQIAEHLKEEMKDCDFNSELGDVAFAFVDHDLKPEKDTAIASAEAILADTEGQLIVSNPCFEIWFLAHFRFTTKGFRSSQDVTSELSKELGGYLKQRHLIL